MIFRKALFVLAILAVTVLGTSCEEPDPIDPMLTGPMTHTVDGVDWAATLSCVAIFLPGQPTLQITGTDASNRQCSLNIRDFSGPGVYTEFGAVTDPSICLWTNGFNISEIYSTQGMGAGAATVEVLTETATTITGTFEFSARNYDGDVVVITDGEFTATVFE